MKLLAAMLLPLWFASGQAAREPGVLVISAGAEDYLLAAAGTLAGMIDRGAAVTVIRVTNDEKNSWNLTSEEAAVRSRNESESAASVLGIKEVISMGYRSAELADVPFTTLRDRLIIYIRQYRPSVLFIPNPYTEYERVLDQYYTGRAAEDAWRAASLENHAPPFTALGLKPHVTPEVYYYAQPVDPRRRDPESTTTFVPQPKAVDIAGTLTRKIKAVQALKTINYSNAMRLQARLESTRRKLPLLAVVNEASASKLAEENVRGLAKIAADGSSYSAAEEFRYAGLTYRIPSKYLPQEDR